MSKLRDEQFWMEIKRDEQEKYICLEIKKKKKSKFFLSIHFQAADSYPPSLYEVNMKEKKIIRLYC